MYNRRNLLLLAASLAALGTASVVVLMTRTPVPGSVDIVGVSGALGEWEVTAKLARVGDTRDLTGPMKMTHVGWCSQSGPLEKSGEMRVRLARLTSSLEARVVVDGVECRFSGSLTDAYEGMLTCPDRRSVQMLLWLR